MNSVHEEWRKVNGYPAYEISNRGRVKSVGRWVEIEGRKPVWRDERYLRPAFSQKGYLQVSLSHQSKAKTVEVHRLVAWHFLGSKPERAQVNHKDGIKTNNHSDNLEWVSGQENMRHALRMGLVPPRRVATKHGKLTADSAIEIVAKRRDGARVEDIAAEYRVSAGTIYDLLEGKTWAHATGLTCRRKHRQTLTGVRLGSIV